MTDPAVTVVTVTFNDEAGLAQTLSSLRTQRLGSFQHVVVDGGSTDGSLNQLGAFPATTDTLVISEPDEGIYDAMNKGLDLARGILVTFLNAGDCYSHPGVLGSMVESHQRLGWTWAYCDAEVVDGDGRRVRPVVTGGYSWLHHAFGRNTIVHQTVFAETAEVRRLGGFDRRYSIAADFHLLLALGRASVPEVTHSLDVRFLHGGLSDRRPGRALWQMHEARVDVLGWTGPRKILDAGWCALLFLYVLGRRSSKRLARRVGGRRAVDWWARRGGIG